MSVSKNHLEQQEKIQELQQIQKATEKMIEGKHSGDDRLLQQFVFVVRGQKTYNLLEPNDVQSFEKSMSKIQLTNIFAFTTTAALSGLAYFKLGLWTPNIKRPWLRNLRHASALIIPALFISPFLSTQIQGGEIQNLNNLAQKYKHKIFEPEFNQKLVSDMMAIKKNKTNDNQQQQQKISQDL